uniref:TBC1 domain family member 30 n=1 Tax=Parascaris univalens TaxID=6257 RepID=A0A915CE45_PARUN
PESTLGYHPIQLRINCSLVNSHIENVSSRFSKGTSSQTTSNGSMLVPTGYFESTFSATQACENQQTTTVRDHFRIAEECPEMVFRRRAYLEKLLGILYEDCRRRISTDVDLTTDSSHLSDSSQRTSSALTEQQLQKLDCDSLKQRIEQMCCDVDYANMKLLKVLKQRAHQLARQAARCNIITAVLQAVSEKRRIDTKLQFSLDPPGSESGFEEWLNAMKAVARLPDGIPSYFRRRLWVMLANYHIDRRGLSWEKIRRVAFNERINPDDDRLSFQIIKDLHRTGWSGISGEAERIHLKRVLLGYARFNKTIGCRGSGIGARSNGIRRRVCT